MRVSGLRNCAANSLPPMLVHSHALLSLPFDQCSRKLSRFHSNRILIPIPIATKPEQLLRRVQPISSEVHLVGLTLNRELKLELKHP